MLLKSTIKYNNPANQTWLYELCLCFVFLIDSTADDAMIVNDGGGRTHTHTHTYSLSHTHAISPFLYSIVFTIGLDLRLVRKPIGHFNRTKLVCNNSVTSIVYFCVEKQFYLNEDDDVVNVDIDVFDSQLSIVVFAYVNVCVCVFV